VVVQVLHGRTMAVMVVLVVVEAVVLEPALKVQVADLL
jgi:hypothetical protein